MKIINLLQYKPEGAGECGASILYRMPSFYEGHDEEEFLVNYMEEGVDIFSRNVVLGTGWTRVHDANTGYLIINFGLTIDRAIVEYNKEALIPA